jgi:hypothetical protein
MAAVSKFGMNGTVSSSRLDGMCVNTMVFTSPMRRASQAAARCEPALAMRAMKNNTPISLAPTPKRSWKK